MWSCWSQLPPSQVYSARRNPCWTNVHCSKSCLLTILTLVWAFSTRDIYAMHCCFDACCARPSRYGLCRGKLRSVYLYMELWRPDWGCNLIVYMLSYKTRYVHNLYLNYFARIMWHDVYTFAALLLVDQSLVLYGLIWMDASQLTIGTARLLAEHVWGPDGFRMGRYERTHAS